MVIHGFPYSGDYVNTIWPGYIPSQYEFTDMCGPRIPAWRHFNDTMLYAGRNTLVSKIGAGLTAAGYTHEYLGPSNFASPSVTIPNGLLVAEGPAYKALVLYNHTYITSAASAALLQFAQSGLPIIKAGSVPLSSVQVISTTVFGSAYISGKRILPQVSVSSVVGSNNSSPYILWRHDEFAGLDAVYVLNRGTPTTFKLTFFVPANSTTNRTVALNATLQQRQTKIFVFTRPPAGAAPSIHAVSHSSNIESVHFSAHNDLEAIIFDTHSSTITLPNGTSIALPFTRAGAPAMAADDYTRADWAEFGLVGEVVVRV
ncbi:hypothetical protein GE09DRAFT_1209854 [Coniochaeta sp. 2T2.1]|nr:hypothetical protein GE09DRAFT_1209854 [Coniochaeta sp. 2T2.1]